MKLNTSWLVFAGASIVWGAVISDDLFANAPEDRMELQQPQAPLQCLAWAAPPTPVAAHSPGRKTYTAAGFS